MKYLIILATLLAMSAASGCRKANTYMTNAEVTGYDNRMCACCGGIWIKLDNDNSTYDLSNTAASMGITDSTTFPLLLRVNWVHDTLYCGRYIRITSFEYR